MKRARSIPSDGGGHGPRWNALVLLKNYGPNITVGRTTMKLDPNFSAFARCLNSCDVKWLVVGGYAVSFHGHPRYTKDFDIWIDRDAQNAENMVRAIEAFGFGALDLTVEDFLRPHHVIRLGRPPVQIDILTDLVGVSFSASWAQREQILVEKAGHIPVIGRVALVANKEATGRLQDLADAERLRIEEK